MPSSDKTLILCVCHICFCFLLLQLFCKGKFGVSKHRALSSLSTSLPQLECSILFIFLDVNTYTVEENKHIITIVCNKNNWFWHKPLTFQNGMRQICGVLFACLRTYNSQWRARGQTLPYGSIVHTFEKSLPPLFASCYTGAHVE